MSTIPSPTSTTEPARTSRSRIQDAGRTRLAQKFEQVLRYVRELADRLGLRDWTLMLAPEPPAPGRNAELGPVWGRKHAAIRVAPHFFEMDISQQRHSLVHELLHCQFAFAQLYAQRVMDKNSYIALELNMECGIDGLADAVAPLLPLPTWS